MQRIDEIRARLGDLYPFESHFLELPDRHRLHYLDEGDAEAEPLLLLHGNPTWSIYYRELVKALRGSYRVIVPDHIGCGLSDQPTGRGYDYTLARRVADIESLFQHLGLGAVSLILHDWGGMIGMAWASRRPERVRRLVLLNTAAFFLPSKKAVPRSLRLARGPLGALFVRGFNWFCRGAVRYCVTRRPLSREVRAAYLAPYDSWAHRIAVHRFVQDIPLSPSEPSYSRIDGVQKGLGRFEKTPMLIGWGLRDFVFDHHFLAEWERRFPHAEVHRFEDCGHFVLEDASDELVPLIQRFLAAHPLAAGNLPLAAATPATPEAEAAPPAPPPAAEAGP